MSQQLRHNKLTMNACAIDKNKLFKALPDCLAEIIWDQVEGLRDAYTDLGMVSVSTQPGFILANKSMRVLMKLKGEDGRPTYNISEAHRFPQSIQEQVMEKVTDAWTPMSETEAAEYMLLELSNSIQDYISDIIEVGKTDIKSLRDIQSGDYFGWEMPELLDNNPYSK